MGRGVEKWHCEEFNVEMKAGQRGWPRRRGGPEVRGLVMIGGPGCEGFGGERRPGDEMRTGSE